LLEALDELLERQRKTLGRHVADHDAVRHLEQHLLLLTGLGIRVRHVEAEIDHRFLFGGVDAVRVGVQRLHVPLVNQHLDLLLTGCALTCLFDLFRHVDSLSG